MESTAALIAESEHEASRQPLIVVVNARSGKRDASCVELITGILERAGRDHELVRVTQPRRLLETAERAARTAVERGGCLVAAGGDGTINLVAGLALEHGCPLGLIPLGTYNFVARTHGIPLDPVGATEALLSATVKRVQVGMVNDRPFLVNASIGLYRKLLEERESFKNRFGRKRIIGYLAALASLLRPHPVRHIRIEGAAGGGLIETLTLFVGNNPMQLALVGIEEADLIGKGRLLGITLRPMGRFAAMTLLLRSAVGRLGASEHVDSFVFRRIVLDVPGRSLRPRRVKVAVDGEVVELTLPLTFAPAPDPLLLLVPEPREKDGPE